MFSHHKQKLRCGGSYIEAIKRFDAEGIISRNMGKLGDKAYCSVGLCDSEALIVAGMTNDDRTP